MQRLRLLATVVAPAALLVAACSLPTDERVIPYDRDDLPPALVETTTTTTTSTTTTVVPTDGSTPEITSTTTLPPLVTAPVDLYYTIGFSDDLTRLTLDLPADATLPQVIRQLEQPRSDVAGFGLRTAVRSGLVETVVVERGTARVILDMQTVDEMSDSNLQRAIAQLVLTLTSYRTPDQGGIGTVSFESEGEGFEVFVPSFGGSSEPGEALAFSDFAILIGSATAPTSTSTTTTVSAETTAPTSGSDPDV